MMSLFSRSLARCGKDIIIQTRGMIGGMNAAAEAAFIDRETVKAVVKTTRGVAIIDEANTERDVTHEFMVLYADTGEVSTREWIKFSDKRYDILDVENCNERNHLLIIRCALTGSTTRAVSDA